MSSVLAGITAKIEDNEDTIIQIVSDSTGYGYGGFSGSWTTTLGILLGEEYDVTVQQSQYAYFSSSYSTADTIHSGSGPTMLIRNGSTIGTAFPNNQTWLEDNDLIPTAPDLTIIGLSINDMALGGQDVINTWKANYAIFIESVRDMYPDTYILAMTQNCIDDTRPLGRYEGWSQLENEWVNAFTPFVPPLAPINAYANAWLLDTRQAFSPDGLFNPVLMFDGTHPNTLGYAAEGEFMADQLIGADVIDPGDPDDPPPPPPGSFNPDTVTKIRIKLAGQYYPVNVKVKVAGSFRGVLARN